MGHLTSYSATKQSIQRAMEVAGELSLLPADETGYVSSKPRGNTKLANAMRLQELAVPKDFRLPINKPVRIALSTAIARALRPLKAKHPAYTLQSSIYSEQDATVTFGCTAENRGFHIVAVLKEGIVETEVRHF